MISPKYLNSNNHTLLDFNLLKNITKYQSLQILFVLKIIINFKLSKTYNTNKNNKN